MELVFLNSGYTNNLKEVTCKRSIAVTTLETTFILDCNQNILSKLNQEKIDNVNFFILTRQDPGCVEGMKLVNEQLKQIKVNEVPLYLEKEIYEYLRHNFVNLSQFEIKLYQQGVNFQVDKILFKPFKLIQGKNNITGLRFLDIVYSEGTIPDDCLKYYKNSNLIIFDAENWFGETEEGKVSINKVLQLYKQMGPKELVLTGSKQLPSTQSLSEIRQYCQEINSKHSNVLIAHGGMRLIMRDHVTQVLNEVREGINLRYPHCTQICSKEKKLIIDSKYYKNKAGKFMYLIEEGLCHGIIRLKTPIKITIKEFEQLEKEHKLTKQHRLSWWKGKEVLFSYGFDIVELYDVPKTVCASSTPDMFIDDFKFIKTEFLVDDYLKQYDVSKLEVTVLLRDLRISNAIYNTYKKNKKIEVPINLLLDTVKQIYSELSKRGKTFERDSMQILERELYDTVTKKQVHTFSEKELLSNFEDKTIIKELVSIVSHSKKRLSSNNEIDILIRMNNPSNELKQKIEENIKKDVDVLKINFLWGEQNKPHETYAPLYDFQLRSILPHRIIRMQDKITNECMFLPNSQLKPSKQFNKIEEVIEYMFDNGEKYYIERNIEGYKATLIKSGTNIKIYSDDGEDISNHFTQILHDAKKLSVLDFVLDCEIVCKTRYNSDIIEHINNNITIPEEFIEFVVSDLSYSGQSCTELSCNKRKSILHSLHFTDHIKEKPFLVVNSFNRAKESILLLNKLSGFKGVKIKEWDYKYSKDNKNNLFIEYVSNNDKTTTSTPGISEVSGKVWQKKKIKKEDHKEIKKNKLTELEEKESKIQSDKLDILIKEKELKMKQTEELLMDKKAKLIKKLEEELNEGT